MSGIIPESEFDKWMCATRRPEISTTIILTYKTDQDSIDVTRKIPGNNKTDIEDNMFEMLNEVPISARLVAFYFAEEVDKK